MPEFALWRPGGIARDASTSLLTEKLLFVVFASRVQPNLALGRVWEAKLT